MESPVASSAVTRKSSATYRAGIRLCRGAAALALATGLSACVTRDGSVTGEAAPDTGGYFVALAAGATSTEAVALYDGLHDALDAYNRRQAEKEGRLETYVETFSVDGYTRLADDRNEIECDLTKCLVKLAGRTLTAGEKDGGALAARLTEAFAGKGLTPVGAGTGQAQSRTYVLGKRGGLNITCTQRGVEPHVTYRCEFDLAAGKAASATAAALEPPARGKLVSCALSPGTVRSAEEAKAELDGGALVELTAPAAASGRPVGYLRVARQGPSVEFVDMFLCGDLSHDHFTMAGAAKAPRTWMPRVSTVGATVDTVESLLGDEARLLASSMLADESADGYTLEVRFKLARDAGGAAEVFGEDRFLLRVPKAWLQ